MAANPNLNALVLCVGNVCRSPMASAFLAQKVPSLRVHSAGLAALVGHSAEPHAQSAMKSHGLDISEHRARQIDTDMLTLAEIILVMSEEQKTHLETRHPWLRGRVYRLGHWDQTDIDDPMGQDLETFQRTSNLILKCCESWANKLGGMA